MDNNKYILQELSKSASSLKAWKRTSSKFPLVREILRKIISAVPPETQLPSIRTIAKLLGTSILPVHKAMSELKNEGFINTKSTSGYFTLSRHMDNPEGAASASPSPRSSFELHRGNLKFATDSSAPFQRIFWDGVVKSLYKDGRNLLPDMNIVFSSFKSTEEIIASNIDIIESNPFSYNNLSLAKASLKIDDFIPRTKDIACHDGSLLPTHFHSIYLFYNSDFLDKFKLPRPSYRTFSAQKEYFKLIKNSTGKLNTEIWCGSSVQPAMFSGGFFKKLIDSLQDSASKPEQEKSLAAAFNEIIDFSSLFIYNGSSASRGKDMDFFFEKELSPLFLGGSFHYWRMRTERPPFNWCAYPMLTVDNSLFKLPIYASVLKGTRDPVGAVRFILSLLDIKIQKMFSSIGLVPVNNNLFNIRNLSEADINYFRKLFEKSESFSLEDYSSYYIFNNILGPELLESSLGSQSSKDAFRNTIQCSKAYLASNLK